MKSFLKLFFLLFLLSCSNNEDPQEQNDLDCSGDYSTAGILVDINEEIYNDDGVSEQLQQIFMDF
jgi:hypothetical protein